MGFAISWIAVEGRGKDEVLAELGYADTGEEDAENESALSCAALPTGWVIVWSNDYNWAAPSRVAPLSASSRVLSCSMEEHVSVSDVRLFEGGREVWAISFDPEKDKDDVSVTGEAPPELASARAEARRMAAIDDAAAYAFDIPLDVAAALCGFKPGDSEFDWGVPEFTVIRRAWSQDAPKEGGGSGGFFSRLFGRK